MHNSISLASLLSPPPPPMTISANCGVDFVAWIIVHWELDWDSPIHSVCVCECNSKQMVMIWSPMNKNWIWTNSLKLKSSVSQSHPIPCILCATYLHKATYCLGWRFRFLLEGFLGLCCSSLSLVNPFCRQEQLGDNPRIKKSWNSILEWLFTNFRFVLRDTTSKAVSCQSTKNKSDWKTWKFGQDDGNPCEKNVHRNTQTIAHASTTAVCTPEHFSCTWIIPFLDKHSNLST